MRYFLRVVNRDVNGVLGITRCERRIPGIMRSKKRRPPKGPPIGLVNCFAIDRGKGKLRLFALL
jgi:hypothetical protein